MGIDVILAIVQGIITYGPQAAAAVQAILQNWQDSGHEPTLEELNAMIAQMENLNPEDFFK